MSSSARAMPRRLAARQSALVEALQHGMGNPLCGGAVVWVPEGHRSHRIRMSGRVKASRVDRPSTPALPPAVAGLSSRR